MKTSINVTFNLLKTMRRETSEELCHVLSSVLMFFLQFLGRQQRRMMPFPFYPPDRGNNSKGTNKYLYLKKKNFNELNLDFKDRAFFSERRKIFL